LNKSWIHEERKSLAFLEEKNSKDPQSTVFRQEGGMYTKSPPIHQTAMALACNDLL
jgi:hypothetical protein